MKKIIHICLGQLDFSKNKRQQIICNEFNFYFCFAFSPTCDYQCLNLYSLVDSELSLRFSPGLYKCQKNPKIELPQATFATASAQFPLQKQSNSKRYYGQKNLFI